MPRGRKKAITNPSEEIEMIDQKIADLQEQISELKKQRKAAVSRAMKQQGSRWWTHSLHPGKPPKNS